MLEATVDAANHSVIRGEAPKGATLSIAKAFETETSPVLQPAADGSLQPTAPLRFPERLDSSMVTGGDGAFSWAVNPSTRPYVAGRYGREPLGPVPPGVPLVNPAGVPEENQEGNILDGAYEEATFTVPAPPEGDAGQVFVDVGWTNPATDWDVYVYDETGAQIASAATGGTNSERATMLLPGPRDVHGAVRELRPGRRGARRRLDRQRDVRSPDARGPGDDGGLDPDVHAARRAADDAAAGRGRARRDRRRGRRLRDGRALTLTYTPAGPLAGSPE